MSLILDKPSTTTRTVSLEKHLSHLPKFKQREGLALSHLLRQRPLSAFQQFSTLQKGFLATGLSGEGEEDLYVFLTVLSHYVYSEAFHPIYVMSSTLDNFMFWEACVEIEVPLLLMELLASKSIFSTTKYCDPERKTASALSSRDLIRFLLTHTIVTALGRRHRKSPEYHARLDLYVRTLWL